MRVLASRFPSRDSVTAHRKALKPIYKSAQTLLGMDGEPSCTGSSGRKAGPTFAGRASKPRNSHSSKRVGIWLGSRAVSVSHWHLAAGMVVCSGILSACTGLMCIHLPTQGQELTEAAKCRFANKVL